MKPKSIVLTLAALFIGIGVAKSQPQSVMKSYNFSRGLKEALRKTPGFEKPMNGQTVLGRLGSIEIDNSTKKPIIKR